MARTDFLQLGSGAGKLGSATGKRYVYMPIFSVLLAKPASLLALSAAAQNRFPSMTEKFWPPETTVFW
jgi:hypothetical protein